MKYLILAGVLLAGSLNAAGQNVLGGSDKPADACLASKMPIIVPRGNYSGLIIETFAGFDDKIQGLILCPSSDSESLFQIPNALPRPVGKLLQPNNLNPRPQPEPK